MLGARWSYSELGWGGYWAWDPVENASLMPWLTGTAFLHSVMIQEKRGMLKTWNVSLVLATGVLAILGTFLVRSGILDSIHAFGASTLGVPFLILIVTMIAGSIYLVSTRAAELRSEHRLDSLLSREAVFLLNNLVLVLLCVAIWWGTFFPLISEAITGSRASIGPPWFDRFTVPLTMVLVLLSGIGPLIAWRRATASNLRRNFTRPVLVAAGALALALVLGGGSQPDAMIMFVLAGFVLGAVGQELVRGTRARRVMAREPVPVAVVSLIRRNRRRYGGYLVHAGMAVLFVGIAASSSFADERDVELTPGQSARVGGYDIEYVRPTADLVAAGNGRLERIDFGAVMHVTRDGETTHADHDALLLPVGRADARSRLALLRGRGDQRGRPERRPAARRLAVGGARHAQARPAHQGGRRRVRRRRGRPRPGRARRPAGRGAARPRALVRRRSAARHLPPARVADGHLDLDRRPGRLPRRADRALAVAARRARHGRRVRCARRPRGPRLRLIDLLVIFVVLALVVLLVTAPLRRRREDEATESAARAELEAARDAKYREIRDAELDYRVGKLSEADWRGLDRGLRAEAVEILRQLDELDSPTSGEERRS